MGLVLTSIFTEAERIAGLQGKLMLAGIVRMTTGQAASVPDSAELTAQFQKALETVRGTVKGHDTGQALLKSGTNDVLRKHLAAFLDLMTQRSLVLGDMVETARRIDELACNTLNVARTSVWLLDEERTKISCIDLFERDAKNHSAGTELFAKDFGPYFAALLTQRTIAAHEAQTDPRTSCFTQVYLKPLGITSMLDVPVWLGGKMVGVVCHEHLGPARVWDGDEERFAYLMGAFLSLSMERNESLDPIASIKLNAKSRPHAS